MQSAWGDIEFLLEGVFVKRSTADGAVGRGGARAIINAAMRAWKPAVGGYRGRKNVVVIVVQVRRLRPGRATGRVLTAAICKTATAATVRKGCTEHAANIVSTATYN